VRRVPFAFAISSLLAWATPAAAQTLSWSLSYRDAEELLAERGLTQTAFWMITGGKRWRR